jgi:SAM-dependent methyltransferase
VGSSWEADYREAGRLWGEGPSELALLAVDVLRGDGVIGPAHSVLDVGCGYGRDAFHLWRELGVSVVAVDPSPRAIELARAAAPRDAPVEFVCAWFERLDERLYSAVTCTNLYHLLGAAERGRLAAGLAACVRPGGLLFVMTLSPADPQHGGKGSPVPGDPGSFVERVFLHFADEGELRREFAAMTIERLEEHAYTEARSEGHAHRHVSWRLVARRPSSEG